MERLQKLRELILPYYADSTDPAHDWPHIGRVAKTAQNLGAKLNANIPVLIAAVYCHDLVNLPKNHPQRKEASELAAKEAEPHLRAAGFSEAEIKHIQACVIEHSFSRGLKPSSIEAAIVQDADRLDALGAIGVLRCAAVNTQMNARFYEPFDPLAETRELDDKKFMIDHYFVKLFKLPDLMNTEFGKAEGMRRVESMRSFLDTLMGEIR
jgi:uncharacterized protein